MKKALVLIALIALLSGCSINYNLEINKDTFNENIIINDNVTPQRSLEMIYASYRDYYPAYIDETYPEDASYVEENHYHSKKMVGTSTGYRITYDWKFALADASRLTSANTFFESYNFSVNNGILIIDASKVKWTFDNTPALDEVIINIKTNLKVQLSNYDAKNGNVYTWKYVRSNSDSLSNEHTVHLELKLNDEAKENSSKEEKKQASTMTIFLAVIGLAGFVFLVVLIMKSKNKY